MDCHRAFLRYHRILRFSSIRPNVLPHCCQRGRQLLSHLRTVIVTAAVYRGFSSSLAALPLTFRHRAGVSPYTSPYGFAETCVFSKQSVGLLVATLNGFGGELLHRQRHPFSRSYGAILPSSLDRFLSIALESSSHLPASVCGTGTRVLPRDFSRKFGISHFAALAGSSPSALRINARTDFPIRAPYSLGRTHPIVRLAYPPSSSHRYNEREVVLECAPVVHRLRPATSA